MGKGDHTDEFKWDVVAQITKRNYPTCVGKAKTSALALKPGENRADCRH